MLIEKTRRKRTYEHTLCECHIINSLCNAYTRVWLANVFISAWPYFIYCWILGIWLFYIQHTYEDSYFEYNSEWDYVKAAVDGSSYYKLPKVLQWVTGNIGFHHVHHLAPRVPNYHLEAAHESIPPLQQATTITLKRSFESIRYKLYDPKNKKFVSFKEVDETARVKNKSVQA